MCGIIGYVGGSDVANTVVEGMKRLEYRGYDSYGFCAFRNNSHFLYKDIGIVSQNPRLAGIVHTLNGDFISGIGHTRWATHGEVSKENAHPQHDKAQRVFVVHNGTVENSPSELLDTQFIVQQLQLKTVFHFGILVVN